MLATGRVVEGWRASVATRPRSDGDKHVLERGVEYALTFQYRIMSQYRRQVK